MSDVFGAIADPTRRHMIGLLAKNVELPLHEISLQYPMGRTAVSKHLSVLKSAGLVNDRKVGRETLYRLSPGPLREVQDWIAEYEQFWSVRLDNLKHMLEEELHE